MTANQIAYFKAKEDQRHNQAVEQEQFRSNRNREAIDRAAQRANQKHYEVSDSESIRSHHAQEAISLGTLGLGYAQLGETRRHNVSDESIRSITATSQAELNAATAGLRSAETAHEWAATETEKQKQSLTQEQTQTQRTEQVLNRAKASNLDIQSTYIPLQAFDQTLTAVGNTVLGGLNYGQAVKSGKDNFSINKARTFVEALKAYSRIKTAK